MDSDVLTFLGVALSVVGVGGVGFVLFMTGAAIAKRMERGAEPDPQLRAELDELRNEVAALRGMEDEIAQLQERVDFAERLLVQRGDPAALPGSEGRVR